jgi:predicted TIM-barrel fold metal-dependent hydrolase
MLDMKAAVEELQWTAGRGSCGVFKLATEINKRVTDSHFHPLYEAAADLNLPICIHTGSANPPRPSGSDGAVDGIGGGTMLDAFSSVIVSGLPQQFPKLRIGFIEAGASWIPYILDRLWARRERMAWAYQTFNYSSDLKGVFKEDRLYVTTHSHEDIPYLMNFGAEDHLMIGTDYSHADQSADIEAIDLVRKMGVDGRLREEQVRKILEDNPRNFYGL